MKTSDRCFFVLKLANNVWKKKVEKCGKKSNELRHKPEVLSFFDEETSMFNTMKP